MAEPFGIISGLGPRKSECE